jgi:acyl-CoA reductase-like NAD-dependent aldehyde dehydrogenase
VTAEKIKWTLDHGERALLPEKRPTNFLMFYKKNQVSYEPLGVVSACVSWNYPFHNLLGPIISALFTGNAIIVKASEQTAWSTAYFTKIAQGALRACGQNPDLVQSIVCWPNEANHLTSHPGISHLTFIGSKEVAHHVAKSASTSLTPLCLELGGKDASILLDDINDVDRVVATMIRGTFQSAGQNCIGIERIICLPRMHDLMAQRLQPIIEKLRLGSALDGSGQDVDVGACISSANFDKLEYLIADAVEQGARLLVGGKRYLHPKFPKGHYFSPTLIVNVTPDMKLARTELFAPVCLLMRAETVDHAIRVANSTEYALGASVFGRNSRNLEKVVRGVRAGMVAVNDFAVFYMVQLPFGGAKGSGYGRFAGAEGLQSLCNMKSVCRDRWPLVIKTAIPGPLQLPIKNEAFGWNMCKGLVEIGYGESLKRRARGIARMVGF